MLTCGHDAPLYRVCSEEGQRTQYLCAECYPAFAEARAARHAREVAARSKPVKRSGTKFACRLAKQKPVALPGEPGQQHCGRRRQGAVAVAA